jgi:hypothetical protein
MDTLPMRVFPITERGAFFETSDSRGRGREGAAERPDNWIRWDDLALEKNAVAAILESIEKSFRPSMGGI